MAKADPAELRELEVQRVLHWLDTELNALRGSDGLDEAERQQNKAKALQAIKGLPFEPVGHALGRWLNGQDADKRLCAVGLIAALQLREHLPALRSLRLEAEGRKDAVGTAWQQRLDDALHALARRRSDV